MALTRRSFLGATIALPAAGTLVAGQPDTASAAPTEPWKLIPPGKARTVSIRDAEGNPADVVAIPPGAREVHIRLTYDQPEILHTAYVQLVVADLGAGIDPASVQVPRAYQVWRPGDDRDLWVTLKIGQAVRAGQRFRVYFTAGGFTKGGSCTVECAEGAVNALPATMPRHREPLKLSLPGKPKQELDIAGMRWSDTGYEGNAETGKPCWRSRLSHGYSQQGNGENGLYVNKDMFPNEALEPQSIGKDGLGRPFVRLHSAKFQAPLNFRGKGYPFQAAVLQAQKLDEWCHRRGIYEADLAIPSQRGAWSAFWLVGRNSRGQTIWPPEIDCMESFNGVYGADYTPRTISGGQHVGKHGSIKRQNTFGLNLELDRLGFPADTDLNRDVHRYSCVIEDDWITHFIDGVETIMYRNMTDPGTGDESWAFYPIVNVAVKAPFAADYASDERADLRWYGLRYYEPAGRIARI
jgi:hypothetical protein